MTPKIGLVSINLRMFRFRTSTGSIGQLASGTKRVLGLAMMATLALAMVFGASIPAAHASSLAIDGTADFQGACTSTCATALTTSTAGDVIYLIFNSVTTPTTNPPTVTDTSGLTWGLRATASNTGGIEYTYYAIAAGTLSADTITVHALDSGTSGTIYVFGISGANTVTPFDPHAGIPATAMSGGPSPFTASITTSNANDMIIGAAQGSATALSVVAPNLAIDSQNFATAPISADSYEVVSSTGTYTVSFATGGVAAEEVIADAVQAAGAGPSVPEFPTGLLLLAVPVLAIYLFMRGRGVSLGARIRQADIWARPTL